LGWESEKGRVVMWFLLFFKVSQRRFELVPTSGAPPGQLTKSVGQPTTQKRGRSAKEFARQSLSDLKGLERLAKRREAAG
jgi:hypothetical protein